MNNKNKATNKFKNKITQRSPNTYKVRINHVLFDKIKPAGGDSLYFVIWTDNKKDLKIGITGNKPPKHEQIIYTKPLKLFKSKRNDISPLFVIPPVLNDFYNIRHGGYFAYKYEKSHIIGYYLDIDVL